MADSISKPLINMAKEQIKNEAALQALKSLVFNTLVNLGADKQYLEEQFANNYNRYIDELSVKLGL